MGASALRWRRLFVLFFLSGWSGLIYESVWSRYVKQLVGSAAVAQVLVLALFMGGMSVGALLAGRVLHRIRAPVAAYAIIEGLIGLYALAFPTLFEFASSLAYGALIPAVGGKVATWGLAGALILPPCVLLGMTFPLMSVGILRRERRRAGEVLAMLYFTNSLGAAVGAVASGFVLVPWIGLPGALMFGAALNIAIMLVAVQDRVPSRVVARRAGSSGTTWLFLAVAFGTGLSSFLYEVGWIRLLSMIVGSATHSFEVMLSAFVLGLALGGLWVRRRIDAFTQPARALAIVQLAMGACAVATLPAYRVAVEAMGWMMSSADERTASLWFVFNVVRYAVCLLIMLPATFCAGMTLPLLTHVMLRRGQSEAAVGNVYGINTLGAIAGAVTGGLVLLPLINVKGLVVVGALADGLLGLALLVGVVRVATLRIVAAGTLITVGAALLVPIDPVVLTSTVFRHGKTAIPATHRVRSYVDGRTASVSVVEDLGHPSYHILYANGKPDASVVLDRWPPGRERIAGPDITDDEPNQYLIGLVPLMARPAATHAALIGFGSGVSCHTLLGSPNLERLVTIEIEPEMVRGARRFAAVNARAYSDPRSDLVFDDAKAYFAAAGARYDFIVSEPTNPWVSGVSSLFTVDFYREVKRYLADGGLLAQWIQGYELSDALLLSVLAAIDHEFEDYLIVRIGSRDWVILASPRGPVGSLSSRPLSWEATREHFELLGVRDVGQIDGLVVANRRLLHPFVATHTPNRAAHPLLDTGAERERFLESSAEFLHALRFIPAPVLEVMGGIERRPYPSAGIGDLRDPHVLYQLEHAALLMRRFEDPGVRPAAGLSTALMTTWLTRDRDGAGWPAWLAATYGVYRESAPHVRVHGTPWWRRVNAVARGSDVPESVASSIELLDALSRRDAERLWPLVQASLQHDHSELPLAVRTIAGAIALELRGADVEQRRQFVEEHMAGIGNGPASEEVAYRVIRAYAARDSG